MLLESIFAHSLFATDEFGRIFTTPSQRAHLDELRKTDPGLRVQIEDQPIDIEEEVVEVEEAPVNSLTVRGLVYRSDGRSTAWINDNNTFEGGVSSQYISVGKIESEKVEIKVPNANTVVNLNVGQTFDPVSESFKDLGEKSVTRARDVDESDD